MPIEPFKRAALTIALACAAAGAASAAGVARVDFATSGVSALAPDGRSRTLSRGSEVEVGETVQTRQGRAQLRFIDGAYMSLQPQTEFKVEQFRYSGRDEASDNIVMNLIKGGMRTITGLIGRTNRSAYRLKTDVATIGIRGTEYSVNYTNSIEVFVTDGAISVDNQAGSFTVPGGTGVLVSNDQTPPQQTDQKPVLPPESPVQKDQDQVQQKPEDPVNPVQEEEAGAETLATETIGSPTGPLGPLVGTFALRTVLSNYDTCQDGCNDVVGNSSNTGTLGAGGGLIAFFDNFGTTTSGGATVEVGGNDAIVAWGRWSNGDTGGDGELAGYNLAANGGELHYVVGLPATNIPTSGPATYSMLGATTPSFTGNVTSVSGVMSSIVVDFGQSSATYHLAMTVNGSAAGTDPQNGMPLVLSGATLSSGGLQALPLTGPFSTGQIRVAGFLAGNEAVRAGAGYFITFSGGGFGEVAGAIAYIKTVQ